MIEPILLNEIISALNTYRHAIVNTNDNQAKEDYLRLSSITEKVIAAMQADDVAQVKLSALAFSRQVSDSFAMQPPEFKVLAQKIAELKKRII